MNNIIVSNFNKDIGPALYWFYNVRILYIKNRIKSLSIKELLSFIFFLLMGIFLFCKYIFTRLLVVQENIAPPSFHAFWICCSYLTAKVLFTSPKIFLRKKDAILLSVTGNNISKLLLFQLICKNTNLFFPLLISIFYSYIQHSLFAFIFAFFSSWLFFFQITNIAYYIKIVKIQCSSKKVMVLLNSLFAIAFFFCIGGIYQNIEYPSFLRLLFYPILLILPSFNGISTVADSSSDTLYSYIIQLFIGILFLLLFCSKLMNQDIKLIADEGIEGKNETKRIIKTRSISPLCYNELIFIKQTFFSLKGFFQLIGTNLVYIFISIYYIHASISAHEPVDSTAISIVFPIFSVIAFPVIYMIPIWRQEMSYLWIYRLNRKGLKKWILTKIISSYIYCLFSLSIANILIFLSVNFIFHVNYMNLVDKTSFFFIQAFLPILTCSFGYFLIAFLPDAYYTSNNRLYNIILISFIWIEGLLCIPPIVLSIGARTSPFYYLLMSGYIIIVSISTYKLIIQKILRKEI